MLSVATRRADFLKGRVCDLLKGGKLRFTIMSRPKVGNAVLDYFSSDLARDIRTSAPASFAYVPFTGDESFKTADLLILTAHGHPPGEASRILERSKELNPDMLAATWFWDNHLAHLDNLRAALFTDFWAESHAYASEYLLNPVSVNVQHLPSCSAQWSTAQLASFQLGRAAARDPRCLVNYVDYGFSARSEVIARIAREVPEAHCLVMRPEDRSRYFSKTAANRFAEWRAFATTIILPVDRDLSTRVFDALLAGLVLVVPEDIPDFDAVIPRPEQERLSIVRTTSLDTHSLRRALSEASTRFFAAGDTGVAYRHAYARDNHLFHHRVKDILGRLAMIGSGRLRIGWRGAASGAPGLIAVPA